jgi:hypothetical protein
MSTLESGLPLPADEPDDDVAAELEALAISRRRKMPRLTLALAVAVVGAGAFIGGAEAQKHLGSSPTQNASATTGGAAASGFAGRFRGGAAGGASGATGASGGGTAGTVTAIKGSTLYIADASGNTVKVTTSAASQVTKTVSGTVKDVRPGDTVVVRGTQQKNGDIAASSVTLGGAGGFGGGTATNNGGATGFGGGTSSNGGG